jgi:hypothetical protein
MDGPPRVAKKGAPVQYKSIRKTLRITDTDCCTSNARDAEKQTQTKTNAQEWTPENWKTETNALVVRLPLYAESSKGG